MKLLKRLAALFSPARERRPDADLLAELRRRDGRPDWRRAARDPDLDQLTERFTKEVGFLREAERYEAEALLGKLALNATTTIEALCALALTGNDRRGWAFGEIAQMSENWQQIEARFVGEDLDAFRTRAIAALQALCEARSRLRIPHLALATALRSVRGFEAALKHLEKAIASGAKVGDRLLRMLSEALEVAPDPALVRRALALPEEIVSVAGRQSLAFRVHLALTLASIRSARPALARDVGLSAISPGKAEDVGAAMRAALDAAAAMPAEAAAQTLHAIAASALFRHSPMAEAERARLELIDATFMLAEAADGAPQRGALLGTLNLLAPCTLRFWEDAEWRRACCARIVTLADDQPEPGRSWLRGKFGFARGDYALAAEAFAVVKTLQPNAVGPCTYIDHRAVAEKLAARDKGPLLGAEGSTFEVLAEGTERPRATVIVAADEHYLRRYGAIYADRLASLAPSGHLHVHLIGEKPKIADLTSGLRAMLPGYTLTLSSEPPGIEAPYYYATSRFLRLPDWLERFPNRIVVTDIDSPCSNTPERFLDSRLGKADVGLALDASVRVGRHGSLAFPTYVYPRPAPWVAVAAWIIALNQTPGARRFATLLAELADVELRAAAARPPAANWTIDQNILCAAYAHAVRHHPEIRFTDLTVSAEDKAGKGYVGQQANTLRGSHWIGQL